MLSWLQSLPVLEQAILIGSRAFQHTEEDLSMISAMAGSTVLACLGVDQLAIYPAFTVEWSAQHVKNAIQCSGVYINADWTKGANVFIAKVAELGNIIADILETFPRLAGLEVHIRERWVSVSYSV